jgi:hypothetical protein
MVVVRGAVVMEMTLVVLVGLIVVGVVDVGAVVVV